MADARPHPLTYALSVISVQTSSSLATATAPLWANFGDDLTLSRDGNVVHWSYDGQSVIVEQQADGAATASFVDTPGIDVVSGTGASAVYRRTADRRYHLTEDSCRAMVSDMIAFFSGEREPFFTFTGARSLEA